MTNHNDEQHPATTPVVGDAFCESDNQTKAEGRQTDVDFPFTTSRTDPPFFYPNKKKLSCQVWDTGNASECKLLPWLGNKRIAASNDFALAKISSEATTSGASSKKNILFVVQLREIGGTIQEPDESYSLSKNVEGVFLRHHHIIAQQARADVAVAAMSAPAKSTTGNVDISSTTNEDIVPDVSLKKEYIARTCVNTFEICTIK